MPLMSIEGIKSPEKHPGYYALYVAFFPQLLAGPIERAKRFLPQLFEKFVFDYWRVTNGLKLMLWGLFQKNGDRGQFSPPGGFCL